MYGGRGANNVFFDDIWVLSLPAFVWEKVYQGTSPRGGHTCHRVGSRTMITIGGTSNTDYNFPPCDWETKGVGVFDMTDLTWGSVYNATQADYEVPSLVAAKIGVKYVLSMNTHANSVNLPNFPNLVFIVHRAVPP